jgi:lysophospholipase L1-like esterase
MGAAASWGLRALAVVAAMAVLLGVGLAIGAPRTAAPAGLGGPQTANDPADAAAVMPPVAPVDDEVGAWQPLPLEQRPVARFLGDSITRGMTEPGSGVVSEYSWFYGLVDDTDGVVRFGGSVAENGKSTSWMAGQVWSALSPKPDILIVHGGTNDVSGEITPPVVVDNLERIRVAAASVGVPLAVCTVPPRTDPAADARALAVNDAIRSWAAVNNVIVLDTAAPLRDPVLGGWLAGYTTDGLHPTPMAVLLMSEAAARTLREIPLGV